MRRLDDTLSYHTMYPALGGWSRCSTSFLPSREAAGFFLDSSGGEVDAAVDQFFATGGEFEAAGAGGADNDEDALDEPPPSSMHVPPVAAPGAFPLLRCVLCAPQPPLPFFPLTPLVQAGKPWDVGNL